MCSSGGPPAALQQWTSQPGVHRDGRTRRVGVLLLFSGNFHSLLAAQLLCSPPLTVICFTLYCSVSPFPVCLRFLKKCFLIPLSCFPTSPLSSFLRPPLVLLFTSVRPTWRWDSPWPSQESWEITLKRWLTLTVKSLFNSAMFRQATHTHTHALVLLHNNQEPYCVQFPTHRSKTAAARKSTQANDALSVTVYSKWKLFLT